MKSYKVVDVFSAAPFLGNPVAVIRDADDLTTAQMQALAAWTNLSETTFFQSATSDVADYRLRIFTPRGELTFAGHPTLGSAHAALEWGIATPKNGVLVQECGKGLVRIKAGSDRLTLSMPDATITDLSPAEIDELEAVLGAPVDRSLTPAIVDVGAIWVVARLADARTVLELTPDMARCMRFDSRFGATGLSVFGAHSDGRADIELRSFAPSHGVSEDPVCGSGNGSVAAFLHARGALPAPDYHASQGRCVGRDGTITLSVDPVGKVRVGGACVTSVTGTIKA